ncbi:MAG: class A beta-lactamase-related serine hydrolase [Bryobacterales bacterium]|nr:class A beta-lactamase-related serine hydrolase [Bryobacterales bacterium]
MPRFIPLFTAATLLPAALFSASLDPKIHSRMQHYADKGTIAGAVMLYAKNGTVYGPDAVGNQELAPAKPMRADSIFQIMSMTKPVTALGIMILQEEGKLSVSDPVEKYLPEFRGQMLIAERGQTTRTLKKPARLITIRDLMTHTSGMMASPPPGIPDVYQKMDLTLKEAVAVFSQHPLDFEPGSRWQYSNAGIATLGRVVEVVADQPYEKFLEDRVFLPLGMKDSFFFPPGEKTGRIAMVYTLDKGKLLKAGAGILGGDPALYRKGAKFPAPEFGLFSTASDLAALYQMMLDGGAYKGKRIVSKASVQVATALHTGGIEPAGHSPGMGYGLAWTVVRDPLGTLQLQSKGTFGHGGAFGTHGWIDAAKKIVGVFLIQRSGGGSEESNAFKQMVAATD